MSCRLPNLYGVRSKPLQVKAALRPKFSTCRSARLPLGRNNAQVRNWLHHRSRVTARFHWPPEYLDGVDPRSLFHWTVFRNYCLGCHPKYHAERRSLSRASLIYLSACRLCEPFASSLIIPLFEGLIENIFCLPTSILIAS
ncbi:hypothetical protein VTN96DRAFT_1223 [Rasamsonia emersonii]